MLPPAHDDLQLAPTLAPLSENPREAIDRIADEGRFRSVQLSATQPGVRPRDLDRSARRDLLGTFRRRDLSIAGLELWIPVEHFRDSARCDHAVETVFTAIQFAADLDRVVLCMCLPDDENETGRTARKSIGQHALHHGVTIADHAVPPASDASIAVGVDPAAWLAADDDPLDAIRRAPNRLASARLVDLSTSGHRGPLGSFDDGRLDVLSYRIALSTAGYEGPMVLDARGWTDPWSGLSQTARCWATSTFG